MQKRWIGYRISVVAAVAVLLSTTMASCLNPKLKELNPCLVSGVVDKVNVDKVDSVDVMFVIDKSKSMIQEQAKIRNEFKRLIQVLSSGDKNPDDGITEGVDFMPAKSLHLAVVSTDLGLPAISEVSQLPDKSCSGIGDDGVFQNAPNPTIEGQVGGTALACAESYPSFLSFNDGDDVDVISTDFQCIAGIGPNGCGFEQQLEAGLKALWPSDPSTSQVEAFNTIANGKATNPKFLGSTQGHGDSEEHSGFLRGTPYFVAANAEESKKMSLLAVIVVSDENDCSMGAQGNMDILSSNPKMFADEPEKTMNLNLRCYYDNLLSEDKRNKYPIERYVAGFKALRGADAEYMVIFGAIVGVPADAISDDLDSDQDGEVTGEERTAYYDAILNHERMKEEEDPDHPGFLRKACVLKNDDYDATAPEGSATAEQYITEAEPGVRFVEVARQFEANGVVRSICETSFTPAMDQIIDTISKQLGGVCLGRELKRDVDGLVNCDITWDMPKNKKCTDAEYAGMLTKPKAGQRSITDDGRAVCTVTQIPVKNPDLGAGAGSTDFLKALDLSDGGLGWYYDDFSSSIQTDCTTYRQRIAFLLSKANSDTAQPLQDPPAGVTVNLVCLNQMNTLLTEVGSAGKIGDECPNGDSDCNSSKLICHPQQSVCVQKCGSTADCPPAWECDTRKSTLAVTDVGICVNPTCSG
jgi:hypothetical protein